MTSFAFVARVGAVAPPVPFGSGQGPQPLSEDDTRRKNYAALNKEEVDCQRTIFVLPLAEASIASGYTPAAVPGRSPDPLCGQKAEGQREEMHVYPMPGLRRR